MKTGWGALAGSVKMAKKVYIGIAGWSYPDWNGIHTLREIGYKFEPIE